MGRTYTTHVYRLDKRSSLIVVAQLSPEFTARVVDRWQELEAQLANPPAPQLPDFTNPVIAARAWADEFEGRLLEAKRAADAEEKLAIAAPKAKALDEIGSTIGAGVGGGTLYVLFKISSRAPKERFKGPVNRTRPNTYIDVD